MDGTIGGLAFVGTATLPRIRGTAPREEAASDIIGDRPQVVRASDGALVWTDIDAAGVTSEVTITRSCAAVPWSEADIALLTCLGPHLSRALRLHHRFAADTQAAPPATATATRLLSQREQECLGWVARGATSRFAARQLGLSSRTVDKHVQSAIAKLGVTNRTAAAAVAVAHGLINI
jgi:DNA-binding CsgD family transcriptional regulator